ncbi:MAG TPA: AbrB/MazE/SpoVT family DNA-binding domain-containing protein [Conexibacter sp.]|nr:AbrB/MazE/SpoVT family DNA-binding domain-containing protein [Conexibacter sp.]
MKAKVSEKGQVTIPKPVRDKLGIGAGDELDFEVEGGRIVAGKVAEQDPIDAVWGILDPLPMSIDEWIDEMRGPAIPPNEGEQ